MSHETVHFRTICNSDATSSLENMSSRGFKVATTVAGVAATAVLAGCASDAPQDTWKPAGPSAQKIQDLQWPIFLTAGIVGSS